MTNRPERDSAVGRIAERPVVEDGQMVGRHKHPSYSLRGPGLLDTTEGACLLKDPKTLIAEAKEMFQ